MRGRPAATARDALVASSKAGRACGQSVAATAEARALVSFMRGPAYEAGAASVAHLHLENCGSLGRNRQRRACRHQRVSPPGRSARPRGRRRRRPAISREQGRASLRLASLRALLRGHVREDADVVRRPKLPRFSPTAGRFASSPLRARSREIGRGSPRLGSRARGGPRPRQRRDRDSASNRHAAPGATTAMATKRIFAPARC